MKRSLDIIRSGFDFVRNNPQIIYTLFLVVIIPIAFFFTSDQFLKVAEDNQDRLERNRIGLLEDVFALFAREHMTDPAYLSAQIVSIVEDNETIKNFKVFGMSDGRKFPIIASMDKKEIGTEVELDKLSSFIFGSGASSPTETFATSFFVNGERYWRGVHAITATSSRQIVGYISVDLSMAQADAVARGEMKNAYLVLAGIILLIVILLARQARIIDYATLYRRLKEVDQMKDDFVSMAAHELRTPLGIIRGYANVLSGIKDLSPQNRQDLERIDTSAKDLALLINDILDVARIQEGKMSLSLAPVDVKALMTALIDSFMRTAQEKGLALRADLPETLPVMNTDETRLRQVLVNIVGNSIKYTPAGEVVVHAKVENDSLVIRVSDTGIGISAEDQEKLFQKFYRVKSKETEDIRGTGLGLWITLQILRSMKGTIRVESIKGKGTDFIVTLPLKI